MKWLLMTTAVLSWTPAVALCDEKAGEQRAEQLDADVKVKMGYLLSLPKDYAKKDKWPLLLFLHGSGERGDDLALVAKHGPPKLIAAGKEFPFIVVSPQCPKEKTWEAFELTVLLDSLEKKLRVDSDRIYVTGLSMGGAGTWKLAASSPQRFAAIAPICVGGDTNASRRLAALPTWVFQGAKDSARSVEQFHAMIDALRKSGGTPRSTLYPDAGHDAWSETYSNPAFYEWLLEQKKPAKSP